MSGRQAVRALVLALALGLAGALIAGVASGESLLVTADVLETMGPAGRIENGAVLVTDGYVAAVGPRDAVVAPEGVRVMHAAVVTPGFIDAHGSAGLAGIYNVTADQDSDEVTGPVQAGLRALDGFNPREPLLRWLVENGVTTVQSGPGEANPIGGIAGIFKTHGGSASSLGTLRFPSALVMSFGERPKRSYGKDGKLPSTRMGVAAVIRTALAEAQTYRDAIARAADDDEGKPPDRDLSKEALGLALSGEIPVIATARREDDIATALRIANEFGLRLQLADGVESYLHAAALAEADVPVLVGPVTGRVGGLETINLSFESPAILQRAGVPIAFQSGFEGYVPRVHVVWFEAAVATAFGLDPRAALEALTIGAARILRIDERVGSLEEAKDADLVLLDGPTFEYTTRVEAVLVNGRLAYERAAGSAPD